jgi:hypothetical protein
MPRLEEIEKEQAPPEAVEFYERDLARYGQVLGNTKLYAHNLPVLRAMKTLMAGYAETTAVALVTKSLVRTRVAVLNGCPF